MLRQVAEGVLVHESEFVQSNAVVVHGPSGVLLIDPGIRADELDDLAHDLVGLGRPVLAGFSTHPHWDHMLWRDSFGEVPRYATALGASTARDRLARGIEVVAKAVGIPEGVPLELLGDIAGLPDGASEVPWDGPRARIVEHRAHAPGHAALVIEKPRVLVSGDMLSDVLVPMLDLDGTVDPIGDYLAALRVFDELAGTSTSSSPVTAPSAMRGNCASASTRIALTWRPCVRAGSPGMSARARRRSPDGAGWPECTTARWSAWPTFAAPTEYAADLRARCVVRRMPG